MGCSETETAAGEEDKASIQAALDEYALRLAEAYAVGDLEALRVYARDVGVEDGRVLALLERHAELEAPTLRERLAIVLSGVAAEKEVAGMEKRIDDLLAESRVIRPEVRSVVVEDVQIWNYANAFVTTLEVWDLRVYAAGTDRQLSESLEQSNRVKYQMKRTDEGWLVLFRELVTAFE
jgi:hypothetical protein